MCNHLGSFGLVDTYLNFANLPIASACSVHFADIVQVITTNEVCISIYLPLSHMNSNGALVSSLSRWALAKFELMNKPVFASDGPWR